MEDIKLIGNLHDYNIYGEDRFQKVQEMLDKYDNLSNFYDLSARIIDLSSPCNEILQHCKWEGADYPCEKLFFSRMTFDGVCCVFNYVRPNRRYESRNFNELPTEPATPHGAGITNGLEIVLKNDLDDYFYTAIDTIGFLVHFFNSRDFPDVLSGALQEFIAGVGQHVLFSIDVDVIRASKQIQSIPKHLRSCRYEFEEQTAFGIYRQSDCFVDCKMKSVSDLCGCIPFVLPITPNATKYRTVCSLIDIPCLHGYSRKWTKYFPTDTKIDDLDLEKQDSLNCNCLPTCDDITYDIYTNVIPTHFTDRSLTRIDIFFLREYAFHHKIDTTLTWFEVISAYGGLMSLIMGLSLISMIEVLLLFLKLIVYSVYAFSSPH